MPLNLSLFFCLVSGGGGSSSSPSLLPHWLTKHRKYHNLDTNKEFHINHSGTSLTVTTVTEGRNNDSNTMVAHRVLHQTENHTRIVMGVNVDW